MSDGCCIFLRDAIVIFSIKQEYLPSFIKELGKLMRSL